MFFMHCSRGGFTLIELVIVIAIIIILSALAPMLTSGVVLERQMYNTAVQLQQDLMLVQNMAITHSSGGPRTPVDETWFVMRLYLNSNTFAYRTTEGPTSLPVSNPAPGAGIVMQQMPSTFGFPASFAGNSLVSVTYGASTSVTSGYVDVVFDNQGLAYWANNGSSFTETTGLIMLTSSSASKQIKVVVSPIGRATIEWVPQ